MTEAQGILEPLYSIVPSRVDFVNPSTRKQSFSRLLEFRKIMLRAALFTGKRRLQYSNSFKPMNQHEKWRQWVARDLRTKVMSMGLQSPSETFRSLRQLSDILDKPDGVNLDVPFKLNSWRFFNESRATSDK